jgi:serine/threonine protein kinase
MTPQRWSQIKEVFFRARETTEEERSAYLASVCGDDRELRAEVELLLARDNGPSLRRPAGDLLESIASQLVPGETVAQYRVESKLGEGGMGAVYLAYDTRLRREVALKVLATGHPGDPEGQQRLMREARAACALNHPNIVTVHEIGSEGSVDFIAMEFVEGKSLKEVIPAKGCR